MNTRIVTKADSPGPPVPEQDTARTVPAHGLGEPRVLIIDDTRAIHEDFRKILSATPRPALEDLEAALFDSSASPCPRSQFILDSAYQGAEGLALVERALQEGRRYALAFVDVRMPPGWDGIETTARLWAADPDLQVVICTAYSDYPWEEMARRLGQTDNLLLLKKPFDQAEVVQIAHALTRKWFLLQQSKWRLEDLDRTVARRTQALRSANEQLLAEVSQRKSSEARLAAFAALGKRLSAAQSTKEAAQLIVEVADQLLGWDACLCNLYLPGQDLLTPVLVMDEVNGQRVECADLASEYRQTDLTRRAIQEGGLLVLRDQPQTMRPDSRPFGDCSRPSASLLFVPIRDGPEAIGVLSIQSYTPHAYDQSSLETLQALADHCGGALARNKAQEALRISEEHFRSVWERSQDGMRLTDREGRMLAVNEAYCKLVKLPREKLLGQLFSITYKSHGPKDGLELYHRRFDASQILPRITARVRFWNEEEVELEISSSFIELGRQGKMVLSIFRDVTERKHLEQQLRQSQKMEAIGQLAGGVAHDFNNLLAVIRGNTELVLMQQAPLPEPAGECLQQVVTAADRAAMLTRQLLAFSRKQVMQSQPLNLNDVIGNFSKMLKRIIGEDIQLQCHYAARLPLVRADAAMLEQVLVNLVVNARDAMPKGGQLVVTTEGATLDTAYVKSHPEARPGEFVALGVSDTGTGIKPEHLPHIFEPFFTTKEVGKGTGLGLATVYGIAQQHGGWVEVTSAPQAGSTFKLLLPALESAPAAAAPQPATAAPAGGTETILLVEDDEAVRSLTRRLLEKFGYKVTEAASGPQALEVWRAQGTQFDLLLTDMVMPEGLNGRELAEQLLAERPALKVLFMSGYSPNASGHDTAFLRRTGSTFLQKPCDWRELLQGIRSLLDAR